MSNKDWPESTDLWPYLVEHEREPMLRAAVLELESTVLDWKEAHKELTWAEVLWCVQHVMSRNLSRMASRAIRYERTAQQEAETPVPEPPDK